VTASVVIVVIVAGIFVFGRSNNPLGATASASTTTPSFSAYYLDIGASASLGFQPTGILQNNGRRTSTGYANDLILMESLKGVALTLYQIGCPGETVQSILSTSVADHCYKLPQTQMGRAKEVLRATQGQAGVVTVDLGFNNVRTCFTPTLVNEACVSTAIAAVQVDMPKVIRALKSAAGPKVHIIGLEYNDPFLSYYESGPRGPAMATESLVDFNRLNAMLHQVYVNAGASVADVPTYFDTNVTTRVTVPNVGVIPQNVEQACLFTWMCYSQPFGPDDHPNDAGYSLIAQAIRAQLPKSW
jgi:lysophospholipase L1-like esterase